LKFAYHVMFNNSHPLDVLLFTWKEVDFSEKRLDISRSFPFTDRITVESSSDLKKIKYSPFVIHRFKEGNYFWFYLFKQDQWTVLSDTMQNPDYLNDRENHFYNCKANIAHNNNTNVKIEYNNESDNSKSLRRKSSGRKLKNNNSSHNTNNNNNKINEQKKLNDKLNDVLKLKLRETVKTIDISDSIIPQAIQDQQNMQFFLGQQWLQQQLYTKEATNIYQQHTIQDLATLFEKSTLTDQKFH